MRHGITAAVARHHKLMIILNIALVAGFVANIAILNSTDFETKDEPTGGHKERDKVVFRRHVLLSSNSNNNKVKPNVNVPNRSSRSRWIVVHVKNVSSALTKEPLAFLDGIRGWSKIVVGPLASVKHGCSSCLDMTDKPSLHSAFITALKHGAREMYIMTSLHDVRKALSRMASSELKGLMYSGYTPFKPCSHFVQPLFGTNRSFGECFDRNWVYSYHVRDFPESLIIGVCQECEQLSPEFENGRIYCDRSTPNVVVQTKSLSQSTFENSLWTYDSFWALFFYILDDMSTSQAESLKFSYITQKLLWDTYTSMAFVRSHDLNLKGHENSLSLRQTHNVIAKFCRVEKAPLAFTELFQQLHKWECKTTYSIIDCANGLAGKLYNERILSAEQFHMIQSYLTAILSLEYSPPLRNNLPSQSLDSYLSSNAKAVYFWPAVRKRKWSQNPFHDLCFTRSKTNSKSAAFFQTSAEPRFENIVLVIVFMQNDPATQIQMAQFFDYIYGQHFRHIVYCAMSIERIEMFAKMYPQPMTVIELKTSDPRLFSYTCVSEAMKMYHDVRGYFHIDSRTLLNPWSINTLVDKLDVPWFSQVPQKAQLSHHDVGSLDGTVKYWDVWNDAAFGRQRFQESVEDLFFITKIIDEHVNVKNDSINAKIFRYLIKYNAIVKRYLAHFDKTSVGNSGVYYGQSIAFFVPSKYRENFIIISEQCFRYTVHSDLVVPTLLKTLDSKGRIISLDGNFLRNSRTSLLTASFRPDSVYLFPWQMHMISSLTRSLFLCETYLPLLNQPVE